MSQWLNFVDSIIVRFVWEQSASLNSYGNYFPVIEQNNKKDLIVVSIRT